MNIILSFLLFFYPLFSIAQESENQGVNPVTFFDLKSSLKGVLSNHKMVKATENDIKAAKLRVKQAKGGFFPSLDITGNYGHENIIKHGQMNNTGMMARDTTAKITQTITDFGFTRSSVQTSKLSFQQTQAMQKQIKNDILLRAITAYLRVIQSRESVKFAAQSVNNIKKQTELEDAAVTAGGGLTSDVLQAKTQLAGAQARQIQFEGVLSAAKHEFEYVFETFPRDLNSLMLLKSVFNDLPKTVEEAEKITLKKTHL